jgi:hypothetical protein
MRFREFAAFLTKLSSIVLDGSIIKPMRRSDDISDYSGAVYATSHR